MPAVTAANERREIESDMASSWKKLGPRSFSPVARNGTMTRTYSVEAPTRREITMTWIKTIPPAQADGELRRVYEAIAAVTPPEYLDDTPIDGVTDSIVA